MMNGHRLRFVSVLVLLGLLTAGAAFGASQPEEEGPVTLDYLAFDTGGALFEWFEERFAEFEAANPNITINVTGIPTPEYRQVILQQVMAGEAPDLLPMFSDQLLVLIDRGYLEPLTPYLEGSDLNDRLVPVVRKVAEVDGNIYAVLRALPPWMLHVNMNLLNEVGIDRPPETIEEFYQTTKAVTEGTDAFGYSAWLDYSDVHNVTRSVLAWMIGFGGSYTSEPGQLALNQPANVEAMTWFRRFKQEEIMPIGVAERNSYTIFSEGGIGMMISGTWLAGIVKSNAPEIYENLEVVRVPMPANGSLTGGGWLGIPALSDNKDEAWALMEHLYSSENQIEWVKMSGRLGSTTDLPEQSWIDDNAPWLNEMKLIAEENVDRLGYDPIGFEAYSAEFKQLAMPFVLEILNTNRPVQDILDEAQAEAVQWAESLGMPQN